MSTTERTTTSAVGARASAAEPVYAPTRRRLWPILLVLAVLIPLGLFVASRFGVPISLPSLHKNVDQPMALLYNSNAEHMLITVAEDGNVESANNVDVKCEVGGGGTSIWIVEDAKRVEEGDVIVRLDQSTIEDQLNAQKILYN